MIKIVYALFIISAVYLFTACSIGTIDLTDNRKMIITHDGNKSSYEISGDIEIIDRGYFLELIKSTKK